MGSNWLRAACLAGAFAAGTVASAFVPGVAQAQGSSYSGAEYQVTFALNCNNPSAPCQNVFGLGGLWGWVALMPGGTGNAQVTACDHGGSGPAGAQHFSFDPTWSTFPSSSAPTPITPTDPNGEYLAISNPVGLPPLPATYGHYTVSFLGATGEITIAP